MKTLRLIKTSAFSSKKIYYENYTSALNALILANHLQLKHPDVTAEFQAYAAKQGSRVMYGQGLSLLSLRKRIITLINT